MKYSHNQLVGITNAIKSILDRSKDQEYSRNLIYSLNKNIRIIQDELELIEEQLEELPEKYSKYQEEIFAAAVEAGGRQKQTPQGGTYIDVNVEGFNQTAFEAESQVINEEYSDVIEEQSKVVQSNNKTRQEKLADVDWSLISLDLFPETITATDMPYEITDLITVES